MSIALRRFADRTAVVDRDQQYSYQDLSRRTAHLQGVLADLGLERGDGVGILSMNSLDYVALQLAIPMSGMYFMSLYHLESPTVQLEQIDYGELKVVLVDDGSFPENCAKLREGAAPGVTVAPLSTTSGDPSEDAPIEPVVAPGYLDVAELALTSGTTGRPKAAVWPERVYIYTGLLAAANLQLPAVPRMLISTPLSHGIASQFVSSVLGLGGCLVLLPRFEPGAVLSTIERDDVNVLPIVPTALTALLDHPDIEHTDVSSLETLIYGGSPLSPDRAQQAIDRFGPILVQIYGTREGHVVTTMQKEEHAPSVPGRLASCGRANFGVEIALLGPDLQPVGPGEIGELCSRSHGSSDGYWRNQELTDDLLAGGWVHSGDLATVDEQGFYTIVDRVKNVVISGAHNIYPLDVENALADHPSVASAAVFGVPDEVWGEALCAVVVVHPDRPASADEILAHVRELRGPVNTPKVLHIVDVLPSNSAGKVDKPALKRRFSVSADAQ